MTGGRFLAGIGALIRDPATGRYLFLRRSASKDFAAAAWECVTGRVDQGESYEQALHREVQEEVGFTVTIDFIIGTSHFYRGAPRPENELLGVLYRCSPRESQPQQISRPLKLSSEHDHFAWLAYADALARFRPNPNNAWLVRTLEWAETMHHQLPAGLVADFHQRGLNINHSL